MPIFLKARTIFSRRVRFVPSKAAGGGTTNITPSGVLTPTGTDVKVTSTTKSGSAVPTGVALRQAAKAAAGGLTPVGAALRQAAKVVAGAVGTVGGLALSLVRVASMSGVAAFVGTLARAAFIVIAGAIVPTGRAVRSTMRVVVGALVPVGDLATLRAALRVVVGTLTPSGAAIRSMAKTIVGALLPAGDASLAIGVAFAGVLTPAGALLALRAVLRTVTGVLAATGAMVRQAAKILTGTLFPVDYAQYILALLPSSGGAAAYWRLGEPIGSTTFADSSANALILNKHGVLSPGVGGAISGNAAVRFNGSSGYLSPSSSTDPLGGLTSVSLGCWYNHQGGAWGFSETLLAVGTKHFIVHAVDDLLAGLTVSGTERTLTLPGGQPETGWHFVVLTWTSGDVMRLYHDGTLAAVSSTPYAGSLDASSGVGVGAWSVFTTPQSFYNGDLDEVAWSSVPWSAAQVAALYALGLGRIGHLTRQTGKIPTGTLTPLGYAAKMTFRAPSGAASASGSLAFLFVVARTVTGTIGQVGILARSTVMRWSGSLTSIGTTSMAAVKMFVGSLVPTGTLTATRAVVLMLIGACGTSGVVVRQAVFSFVGATASSGRLTRASTAVGLGAISMAGGLTLRAGGIFPEIGTTSLLVVGPAYIVTTAGVNHAVSVVSPRHTVEIA